MSIAVGAGRVAVILGSIGFLLAAPPAHAQTLLRGPGAAALDPLFKEVLAAPNNVATNLSFARRAIELEDFEAAVSTLERLLIGRTDLPLIRLELGMLYLRLEAPELAEAYFLQVLESENLKDDARARARVLLASTRKAGAKGSFAFSVSMGVKHQSNAVTRPVLEDAIAQNAVRQQINPAWPDLDERDYPNLTPDSDAGTTASIGVSYSRELDGLTERRFNASINHYASRQDSQNLSTLDIDVTSVRMGLVLPYHLGDLARRARTPLSFSPYISGTVLSTDAVDNFSTTGALGLSVNSYVTPRNPIGLGFELGHKSHNRRADAPKDGGRYNVSVNIGHIHRAGGYSAMALKLERSEAESAYEAATGGALSVSHSRTLWGNRLGGSLGWRENRRDGVQTGTIAPIDQSKLRYDKDLSAGLSFGRSVFGVAAELSVGYIKRDSNLPEAQYEDVSAALNFSRSFQ